MRSPRRRNSKPLLRCRPIGSSTEAFRPVISHLHVEVFMTLPSAEELRKDWETNPRWQGVERPYKAEDVVRLRGSVHIEHSLARLGAEKLWKYVNEKPFVNALGALTGNQAMQQVKAGLDAIYLSGWQVAGDANLAGEMYPDQS